MKLSKNVVLSLEILTTHKLRTGLSILGIVIGIAAVVIMVSAGKGAEKRILDCFNDMGSNLIVVSAGQMMIITPREKNVMDTATTLTQDDAQFIAAQCPSVALASPAVNKTMPLKWGSEIASSNVVGMNVDGFDVRNITTAAGRLFLNSENRGRRRVAIIGFTTKKNLFGNNDPIGEQILIGQVPFEIIGVIYPKGLDVTGYDQDNIIIVPLETAMRRLMNIAYVQHIYVQALSSDLMETAEKEIGQLLRQRHRLKDERDDFTIQNQLILLEAEREIAADITLLIGSVAGISLLVGGVGILAVMLISVRERMNEIGLRRAVGALRGDIRNQFLIEAALLAGSGGVVGIAVGIGFTYAISSLGYWQTIISWPAVGASFAFSVAVGIIFGIYPAIRAATLEPIEALRAD